MLIWLSGELQGEVAKGYTDAMRHLRIALKPRMTTADYGDAVHEWAVIGIVKKRESPLYCEGWQFNRRRAMAEFRLKLDYDAFVEANDSERQQMLFATLLRSVGLSPGLKIAGFDPEQFLRDLMDIGIENALV